MSTKDLVQKQFAAHADDYVASTVHAQGYSLDRLVDLLDPQPGWRILDVATGGGHMALACARRSQHVMAIDLTRPMLQAARRHIDEQGITHVSCYQSDAERFPLPADQFDAVTCRVAAHHFPDIAAFVHEAVRVLKPGGQLGLTDNVVSGEPLVARCVNSFEKLRDPSHHWAYSLEDWEAYIASAGLEITHAETFRKKLDFDEWAGRMGVTGSDLTRLRVLLVRSPEEAQQWLSPRQVGGRLVFTLTEAIIVGRKPL
jgi:ubiquinone/menaquinone biosynthesis C-methylase UbiE